MKPGRRSSLGETGVSASSGSDKIKVCVRVRPSRTDDIKQEGWVMTKTTIGRTDETRSAFAFERVFDMDTPTASVFEEIAAPIVDNILEGFNGTIFAYGQTGSGKTHTMLGSAGSIDGNASVYGTEEGVIPLTIHAIFAAMEADTSTMFLLRCSYVEIYNEEVNDLLDLNKKNLKMNDLKDKGFQIKGLTETIVTRPAEVFALISKGTANRQVGKSDVNEHSSRSHSIFRMVLESTINTAEATVPKPMRERSVASKVKLSGAVKVSELNLVDLAGCESLSYNFDSKQQKETKNINLSLTHLKTVITKLSEGNNLHIPYRESALTKVLRNSLGGNAKTALICTMSADEEHALMSKSTLNFGTMATKVTNAAHVNEEFDDDKVMLKQFKKRIDKMEEEKAKLAEEKLQMAADFLRLKQAMEEMKERESEQAKLVMDLQHVVVHQEEKLSEEDEAGKAEALKKLEEVNQELAALQAANEKMASDLAHENMCKAKIEQEMQEKLESVQKESVQMKTREAELNMMHANAQRKLVEQAAALEAAEKERMEAQRKGQELLLKQVTVLEEGKKLAAARETELSQLKAEREAQDKEMTAKMQALNQQATEKAKELAALEQTQLEAVAKLASHRGLLNEAESRAKATEDKLAVMLKEKQSADEELKQKFEALKKAETNIHKQNEEVKRLQQEREQADAKITSIAAKNKSLQQAERDTAMKLDQHLSTAKMNGMDNDGYLAHTINDYEIKLDRMQRKHDELLSVKEAEKLAAMTKLVDLENKLKRMSRRVDELSAANARLQQSKPGGSSSSGSAGGGGGDERKENERDGAEMDKQTIRKLIMENNELRSKVHVYQLQMRELGVQFAK